MRFQEVIFMLHRAEGRAESQLHVTVMRLAALLYVNINATNYVVMVCNFNVDRLCMSPAEKAIHDYFILFRRTKNNKTIFVDRSME